jgi:hypothetical protein
MSVVVVNFVTIAVPVHLVGQRQNEQIATVAVDLPIRRLGFKDR